MKTNQLILAAALVALAACTKDNVVSNNETLDNEIGFNAVTKMATKANNAIITGNTYSTDNTFKVWGWQSPVGDFSEFADNAASNFMSNLTISWCGGPSSRADAWRNSANYYYWPYTGKIGFLAIHPSDVAPSTTGWDATNDKPNATIADYTISAANDSTDLMFACAEGSRRADALPLTFNHALSQIQFRVMTYDDYHTDMQFSIDSIKINNIDLSGDVSYSNATITWSDNTDQDDNWDYFKTTQVATYAASQTDAALYGRAHVMIPQAAHADDPATEGVIEGTTLTIGYTMQQLPANANAPISGTVEVSASQEWLAGKRYVYTLCFNLNEITFNPTVNTWVDVNVDTINIP